MVKENAIFIRAKLSSTRLPRKHLLIVQGLPIIKRLIDRIKYHTNIKKIVLCTTDEFEDDELVDIATAHEIDTHRWKKGDVLGQYVDAAHQFEVRNVINIDADDPLIDYTLIDETAAIMDATDTDYVTWEGYPLGCTPSGMSARGLRWLASEYPEPVEHIFAYFEKESALTKLVIKETSPILSKSYIKDIRLTLDYPEDYELFKTIFDNIYSNATDINFSELMEFIDAHQDVIKINSFRNEEFRKNQLRELKRRKHK